VANFSGFEKLMTQIRKWKTHFTEHGAERSDLRLSMHNDQIAKILDNDRIVSLGTEAMTHRASRLFFSDQDDDFFVVIQDMNTGEVVTILPVPYWLNLKVKTKGLKLEITPQDYINAVKKIDPHHPYVENYRPHDASARVVRFQGSYFSDVGRKRINLGSISFSDFERLSDKELADKTARQFNLKLRGKGVNIKALISVKWALGKQSEWKNLDFESFDEFQDALKAACASAWGR
jgi:hypothetical protein